MGELLSESTRSSAVNGAAKFTEEMIATLEAAEHPDMTPELAEVLSTSKVELNRERMNEDGSE